MSEINLYRLIIVLTIVIGGILLFFFIRKNKKNSNQPDIRIQPKAKPSTKAVKEYQKPIIAKSPDASNTALILGDFTVFDRTGMDITSQFTSKLKQLFGLIMLNSKPGDSGISSTELSACLWPEREFSQSKNLRGVTINHLRKILNELDGIDLVFQDSKWIFSIKPPFFSDYLDSYHILSHKLMRMKTVNEKKDELLRIIKKGELFPDLDKPWLYKYKEEYEDLIEDCKDRIFKNKTLRKH